MANRQRNENKEVVWREVLRRFARSGSSVRSFCERERLTESAFYAWRRTIAERDTAGGSAIKRPHQFPKARSASRPAFLPVVVEGNQRDRSAIAIELAGGRVLRLPESMATERLVDLVLALEACGLAVETSR